MCPQMIAGMAVRPMVKISATPSTSDARASERSEEHTSELQSRLHLVCRLLLEKKKKKSLRELAAQRSVEADLVEARRHPAHRFDTACNRSVDEDSAYRIRGRPYGWHITWSRPSPDCSSYAHTSTHTPASPLAPHAPRALPRPRHRPPAHSRI